MSSYEIFKLNLHFHTGADKRHALSYGLQDGVQAARTRGYDALALTYHGAFAGTEEEIEYAHRLGILLIPGIEAEVRDEHGRRSHVVVLNCEKSIESVVSFDDLRAYKAAHPDIFIIAAHPFFYGNFSLHENLEKHIDLFDAIEQSWFYTQYFDRNIPAKEVAEKHGKSFISTSDTHFLDGLDSDYALVEAGARTPEAIFQAIRAGAFKNVSTSKSFAATFVRFATFTALDELKLLARRLL